MRMATDLPHWLNREAWSAFQSMTANAPEQGDIGHPLKSFFGYQDINRVVPRFFERTRTNRDELARFVADPKSADLDRFLAIAAWGSMNREHAASATREWSNWSHLLQQVRSADFNRGKAYEAFDGAYRRREMPGVGPAYFTKFVMYLRPDLRGYILDQWTGKAVEVLSADGFRLHFDQHRLSPRNSSQDYEAFCKRMDELASICCGTDLEDLLPKQAHAFESRLFSEGGKGKRPAAAWRSYVRRHWRVGE